MRILVSHEKFGRVRRAFRELGHDAWSCDIQDIEPDKDDPYGKKYHLKMDVSKALKGGDWDMLISFPDCTFLTVSGLHHNKKNPARRLKTKKALDHVRFLMRQKIKKIVIENPIGCISTQIRKPDQIFQPYMLGENASKATCLWLKGVDKLKLLPEKKWFPPRIVVIKGKEYKRWGNQTDSGQNNLGPSPDRAAIRGKTYMKVARAFARSWG